MSCWPSSSRVQDPPAQNSCHNGQQAVLSSSSYSTTSGSETPTPAWTSKEHEEHEWNTRMKFNNILPTLCRRKNIRRPSKASTLLQWATPSAASNTTAYSTAGLPKLINQKPAFRETPELPSPNSDPAYGRTSTLTKTASTTKLKTSAKKTITTSTIYSIAIWIRPTSRQKTCGIDLPKSPRFLEMRDGYNNKEDETKSL